MESFLQYWEHIPGSHRVLILLGGMIFFWLVEGNYPLFRFSYKRYRHAGVNLVFLLCTLILNLAFGFTTIKICEWTKANGIGLFNIIEMPIWLLIILSLLLGDFSASMRRITSCIK
ncbi:MAG: hypothetical protein HC867_04675 [Bacteroidia bacterium]|nr:hypothetical protein [Bacteroidia bacterium]